MAEKFSTAAERGEDAALDDEQAFSSRLAEAEAAVAALAAQFIPAAKDDLNSMIEAADAARDNPQDRAHRLQQIQGTAHNIKGQGGSFGFDLLTEAGASLCAYIRRVPAADIDMTVIDKHLDAMGVILDQDIRGPGGAFGVDLMGTLNSLTNSSAR